VTSPAAAPPGHRDATTRPRRAATVRGRAADAAAAALGAALGRVCGLLGRVRPAGRSLHPRGRVVRATLVRHGLRPGCGVEWLDTDGEDEVLARRSRSAGLPEPWPDVAGLALRVPLPCGEHADVLMSSAGTGLVGRHLVRPTHGHHRPLTTLFPLRSPVCPVLLGAFPTGPDGTHVQLRLSRVGGTWRPFGELVLHLGTGADRPEQDLRFDAVLHPLPGLPAYGWTARLREPAYSAARRACPASGCGARLTP